MCLVLSGRNVPRVGSLFAVGRGRWQALSGYGTQADSAEPEDLFVQIESAAALQLEKDFFKGVKSSTWVVVGAYGLWSVRFSILCTPLIQVSAWGCGACLGCGSSEATALRPKLIEELAATRIVDISIGDSHCLALSHGKKACPHTLGKLCLVL